MDNATSKYFLNSFKSIIENNVDDSIDNLKRIVLKNSESKESIVLLGSLFRIKGDYIKAIHMHEGVLKMIGVNKYTYDFNMHELILDYVCSENYEVAKYYLNKFMPKNNKETELFLLLAKIQYHLGDYKESIDAYKRYQSVSKKGMNKYIAWCYLGMLDNISDRASSAYFKLLKRCIKAFPEGRRANMLLMDYYLNNNKKNKSLEHAEYIIDNDYIMCLEDLLHIESIFYESSRIDKLAVKLRNKISEGIKNPFFFIYLSDFYEKVGKDGDATALLQEFMKDKGPIRIVFKKYAHLLNDTILLDVYDENNFECVSCKQKSKEYSDVCSNCGSIQALEPF